MLNEIELQTIINRRVLLVDFDGTLVDTNPLHLAAYNHVLADFGVQLSAEEYVANLGGGGIKVIERICLKRGLNLSPATIVKRKVDRYLACLSEHAIPTQAHLAALISRRQHRVFIVTDSSRVQVELALKQLNLASCVEAIVAPADGFAPKPAPDLYLRAVELAGCPSDACIAFEDTEIGETAALRAGVRCIRRRWFE